MRGIQYAIDLIDRTFTKGANKAKAQALGLDKAIRKTNDNIKKTGRVGRSSFSNLSRYAKRAAVSVGLVFGLSQVVSFGNEITSVAAKMEGFENAITFASGADGARNLQFVDDTVARLNTDLLASRQGFQTIAGALRGTSLEGQATRDIFEGMSIAATSMNLSADNLNGSLIAFGQIASKGKVQAEELRGQLGERIPGAFNIAAKAMGVTQEKLNKMMELGQLYADDFLPRFAAQLKKEFSGGLAKAATSMQASINKMNNAIVLFKVNTAEFFRPMIFAAQEGVVKILQYIQGLLPKLEPLITSFKNLFKSLDPISNALDRLGGKMGGAEGIINGLAKAIDFISPIVEIFAMGIGTLIDVIDLKFLGLFAGAIWAINIAMYANPVGLVIAAIVALVGVITYAWQRVGWFRGGIMMIWETMKGWANAIKTLVVRRFKEMLAGISGVAKAIKLVFQGEWTKAFDTAQEARDKLFNMDAGKQFVQDVKNTAKAGGLAYAKGLKEAEENNAKDLTAGSIGGNAIQKLIGGGGATNPSTTPTGGGADGARGASVSGGGGSTTKHTTFNIQSMVQNLTVQTTNLTGSPSDVKAQLERVFLELMADLELRASS